MKEFSVSRGEDFALCGQLLFQEGDTAGSLDEFDVSAVLTTTAQGPRITASTDPKQGQAQIVRRGEDSYFLNVTAKMCASLSEGPLSLSLALTHKASGSRHIITHGGMQITQSKIDLP